MLTSLWKTILDNRDPLLKGIAKNVLAVLASHANPTTYLICCSLQTIADDSGWSTDAVKDAIKTLIQLDYLKVLVNPLRASHYPNLYVINCTKALKKSCG